MLAISIILLTIALHPKVFNFYPDYQLGSSCETSEQCRECVLDSECSSSAKCQCQKDFIELNHHWCHPIKMVSFTSKLKSIYSDNDSKEILRRPTYRQQYFQLTSVPSKNEFTILTAHLFLCHNTLKLEFLFDKHNRENLDVHTICSVISGNVSVGYLKVERRNYPSFQNLYVNCRFKNAPCQEFLPKNRESGKYYLFYDNPENRSDEIESWPQRLCSKTDSLRETDSLRVTVENVNVLPCDNKNTELDPLYDNNIIVRTICFAERRLMPILFSDLSCQTGDDDYDYDEERRRTSPRNTSASGGVNNFYGGYFVELCATLTSSMLFRLVEY